MRRRRPPSAADLRRERRWDIADEAPRLLAEVPNLQSLRMVVSESRDGTFASSSSYTRLFVLESAPAYFWIPCSNPRCEDGGHDLTHAIMSGLKAGNQHLHGQDECFGSIGEYACNAVIRFDVEAGYRDE